MIVIYITSLKLKKNKKDEEQVKIDIFQLIVF